MGLAGNLDQIIAKNYVGAKKLLAFGDLGLFFAANFRPILHKTITFAIENRHLLSKAWVKTVLVIPRT